jgi:chromosome segregation ATPase
MDDAFALLEEKVQAAAAALKRLGAENASLRRDLDASQAKLKDALKAAEASEKRKSASAEEARKLEALQKDLERARGEAAGLRNERSLIQDRIARLVSLLGEIEAS